MVRLDGDHKISEKKAAESREVIEKRTDCPDHTHRRYDLSQLRMEGRCFRKNEPTVAAARSGKIDAEAVHFMAYLPAFRLQGG